MTTATSSYQPIQILPGVLPPTDRTSVASQQYTAAQGIRFFNGYPQKRGGNIIFDFANGNTIEGTSRTVFSAELAALQMVIGSNEKLYSVNGSILTNITPLETTTHTVADSLATHYGTLASNPLTTVSGSKTITVTDSLAASLQAGDTITLSGASTIAGIPNTDINIVHIVRSIVDSTHYTISVATAANAGTSGGGASVVRSCGLITVSAMAHGQANGDRTKILDASDTGGILAADINLEFIIRNVTTDSFDIMTAGTATSSVIGGGGVSTTYQKEIASGAVNQSFGQGYGLGLYGAGLYGVSKTSNSSLSLPRIWYVDRFANSMVLTPGNQGEVYTWDGNVDEAPVALNNAPSTCNYVFVSDNTVITFGYNGVQNKIFASNQGDPTNWTASSTNTVFEDNIEGAGRLLSHVPVNGLNLIFTNTQTYTFQFIGLPAVWSIQLLDGSIGILGPMARCVAKGVAFWIGQSNFYMWRGGTVEIIPANTQPQSTILNYIFQNLNTSQQTKSFAWYNAIYDEVWFHIPSSISSEPDTVARVNLKDFTWVPDSMNRTAAEYPHNLFINPRLMDTTLLRLEEYGTDDDTNPLSFSLTSNFMTAGKNNTFLPGFIPDSNQIGNINFNVKAKRFPQSAQYSFNKDFIVSSTTEQISSTGEGRFWKLTWSGSQLGQSWQMGQWFEYWQKGYPQ